MYKLKYSYVVIISPLVSPIIIYRLCMNKRSAYNIVISISAIIVIGTGKGIVIYGKGKS